MGIRKRQPHRDRLGSRQLASSAWLLATALRLSLVRSYPLKYSATLRLQPCRGWSQGILLVSGILGAGRKLACVQVLLPGVVDNARRALRCLFFAMAGAAVRQPSPLRTCPNYIRARIGHLIDLVYVAGAHTPSMTLRTQHVAQPFLTAAGRCACLQGNGHRTNANALQSFCICSSLRQIVFEEILVTVH